MSNLKETPAATCCCSVWLHQNKWHDGKISGGQSQLVNNAGTELDIVESLWCETTTEVVWFSVNDPLLPPPLILTLLRHRLWWTEIHIEKLQVKNDNLDWPFTLTVQWRTSVRLFCVHCPLLSECVGFGSCLFDKMTDYRHRVKKKCGFFRLGSGGLEKIKMQ